MIYKITLYLLLPIMIFSLFLSMRGVQQIAFGDQYYTFIRGVSTSFNEWRLTIPDIPKIPNLSTGGYDGSGLILEVLKKIANFFVFMINAVIGVLNIVTLVLNILIGIIQFILTVIWSCRNFINGFARNFAYA